MQKKTSHVAPVLTKQIAFRVEEDAFSRYKRLMEGRKEGVWLRSVFLRALAREENRAKR